jgi:hypothetical protein
VVVKESILSQVIDVKGPDGMTVLHHSAPIKQDAAELRRRYTVEAKQAFKEFAKT